MNASELLKIRLYNQLLATHHLSEPQEVVSWMGAMQSQSLDYAKWAIGARLEGKTVKDVDDALNTGKIIRTHILRPTWHFVSAEDVHWMFDLSNPRLRPIYDSYLRMHGADEAVIAGAVPLVEKALTGGKHLTKQEIGEALATENVTADAVMLSTIIHRAEMEGIIVNGLIQGAKQTYTLFAEWAPRRLALCREEALERLARKYFTSHGPATVQDFAWWSGLTVTDCKLALQLIKDDFICETANGRVFWMKNDMATPPADTRSALLLPPFDEFVVSYKDRSELIEDIHYNKVMTKNGLFDPTIMLDGEIVGSWKKAKKKGGVQVELSFFNKTAKKTQALFKPQIKRIEEFY